MNNCEIRELDMYECVKMMDDKIKFLISKKEKRNYIFYDEVKVNGICKVLYQLEYIKKYICNGNYGDKYKFMYVYDKENNVEYIDFCDNDILTDDNICFKFMNKDNKFGYIRGSTDDKYNNKCEYYDVEYE